jgi:vacuolar protein sorting-associated protein 52
MNRQAAASAETALMANVASVLSPTAAGGGGAGGAEAASTTSSTPHDLSADLALFLANPSLRAALTDGSLDLQSYSDTVQMELNLLESQCISVYQEQADEIEALQRDLCHCRTVLAAVKEMLLGFQADLGGLSGEIRFLQEKSKLLDTQLTNRKAAEQKLRHFLSHIVIAPSVATAILHGPVNGVFVEAVQEVQQLYKNCSGGSGNDSIGEAWSCDIPVSETVAGREMKQEIETLRLVAVKRSREYLLQQMAMLKRPQTNVRIIQVHGLLKFAALYDFLQDLGYDTELFNVYCDHMRQTLQSLFATYGTQLLHLDLTRTSCTRTTTAITVDDAVLRSALLAHNSASKSSGGGTGGGGGGKRLDAFCLGTRAKDCLGTTTATDNNEKSSSSAPSSLPKPIAAHIATLQKEQYPYERLFQSIIGHLVDAVTNEHVFCRQFFQRDAFAQLFPNTLSLLTEQLENYLFTCNDAICILLMVSVTYTYRRLARQRKIHSLDAFFDQLTHLLWPRLKIVMEFHLRSIQTADASKIMGNNSSADLHAHYVSRRFGEFCCSLLLILHNKEGQQGGGHRSLDQRPPSVAATPNTRQRSSVSSNSSRPSLLVRTKSEAADAPHQSAGAKLLDDIGELIDAFILLLERLAEEKHPTQKKRTVFLINNLDHIVAIFQERRVTGKECTKLVETLIKYRERFVEEELLTGFSKMIAFVQQTELHLQQQPKQQGGGGSGSGSGVDHAIVNPTVVESLLIDFASHWKEHMEHINKNVLSYFSNFRNGMEILKHCLTQLLLYYTRFQDILRKVFKSSNSSYTKMLVPTNVILAEIKKYALVI